VCAMLFTEYVNDPNIDMAKVLKMIMLHDTIEIYSGDTFAYDTVGKETQSEREQEAAEKLFSLLPKDQKCEFHLLWREFEEMQTSEAKYARLVDSFMPLYHNYMTEGQRWKEFGVRKSQVLKRANYIRMGSEVIWEYACDLINESVDKGYLQDD